MAEQERSADVWAYAQGYYDQAIADDLKMLAERVPDVASRWLAFRRAVFPDHAPTALSPRLKELIVTAVEVALCKTNPPPTFHARKAVDAGATVEEVAQALSVAVLLAGMMTYRESGRFALKAALERSEELKAPQR